MLRVVSGPVAWEDRAVLSDGAIVAALRVARPGAWSISAVGAVDGIMGMRIEQADGRHASLRVGLPSTGAPQWWSYAPPTDADDWVRQFLIWIDEEVETGGLGETRERTTIDGDSHVIAEAYGWRRADPTEHARLQALAGPSGWHDRGRSSSPDDHVGAVAERELVVDGERFLVSVQGATHRVTWLTGPDPGYGYGGTLVGSQGTSAASIEALLAATVGDDEYMRRDISAFLAEIDPATGYLRDDDDDEEDGDDDD
jgi:hypothetical protein